ncbi:MerR family transcriptional regulator [Desemzia sp. RIT804]|uniref:MerR family transcriptional regulator n=1 Tax=Desemzia sp. RIT 804 TaxID=2810209 RepID=UPI0019504B6C|nr:MerR family transcriptional regulator [Desemzia sp. RIT 804]MBM6614654.1 MerR family transcriptional regulator [Desemzia sp. RIT 804]
MEYTVNTLSRIASVSKRTLHYYDEIGLLSPKRKSSNGYRIYGEQEVEKLQQILFYRNLDMPLEEIKQILDDVHFDSETALVEHRQRLLAKKIQLDQLLTTIDKTLANKRGEIKMSDKEKFEGFKKELIEKNETQYGEEVREKYGTETVEKSNKKFASLSKEEYEHMQQLAAQILEDLKTAMQTKNSNSEEALKVAALHKEWLTFTWPTYSKEAHKGLAQMYVDDPRFTKYYDEPAGEGAAEFLRDAVFNYIK